MLQTKDFSPDWISPPGDTIIELLDEFGLSIEQLNKQIGLTAKKGQQLLDGELSICQVIAVKLESTLHVPSKFWLARDYQYQSFKKKIQEREQSWLTSLPISDMVKHGWIPKNSPRKKRVKECLKFFRQESIDSWYDYFENKQLNVAYRTSKTLNTDELSVFTWLQYAKNISCDISTLPWDKNLLIDALKEIRDLTLEPDPQVFIPKLKTIFAEVGIIFIIAKTPSGCRASGATCFFQKNKPTLIMSFRHLTDDHFWFTLFHEIGHLVLHSSNQMTRIERNPTSGLKNDEELEADSFATDQLIPQVYQAELKSFYARDWKKIIRFAKKIGVSKGIVLGQLQFMGNIEYSHLNKFKVRYKWS